MTLTEHLQKLTDKSTNKIIVHSAFNFIYGCCLVIHLHHLGVFEPHIGKLTGIDKLIALLEGLEKEHPELYVIDMPHYKLDNKTKEFMNEKGVQVFRALTKELKDMPSDKLEVMLNEFFQQSF